VEDDFVSASGIAHRDDEWLALVNDRDVRDKTGIEHRVQCRSLGDGPIGDTPYARAIG
jgi:hypothetical protein